MVRVDCDRLVEALDRLAAAVERQQGAGAVEPGFGKVRVAGDRAIEVIEREFVAAELLLRHADQIVRRDEFRLDLEQLAGKFDAFAQAVLLAMDGRQKKQRIAIFLVEREHLFVTRRGLGQSSPLMQESGFLHEE